MPFRVADAGLLLQPPDVSTVCVTLAKKTASVTLGTPSYPVVRKGWGGSRMPALLTVGWLKTRGRRGEGDSERGQQSASITTPFGAFRWSSSPGPQLPLPTVVSWADRENTGCLPGSPPRSLQGLTPPGLLLT